MGDATCNKIEEMLESMQPYLGDPANVLQFGGRCFQAAASSSHEIIVVDAVFNTVEVISRSLAMRTCYPIGDWYAKIHHHRTGTPYNNKQFYQTILIAEVYAWNACQVLEQGIPYPWDSSNHDHNYH